MSANMSAMMPILQSLMQLGPKVDEIQAAPQAAPMMQQNNTQRAGLFSGMGGGTDSIAEALLAPTTGGNTGALAKAKMAYDDTQSSRLPGIAGGIEGVVDMFRAGGKREALGEEMQIMSDAQAAEAARLEAKGDAEAASKAQAEEEIKRKRATVVMQIALQAGKSQEEAMAMGDLAYGSEETAREIYSTLNPEASTLEKEANYINTQGGNLTPQEMEERFKRTGQNNTTIMNPLAGYYLRDENGNPIRDETGALQIDPGSKEGLELAMARQEAEEKRKAASKEAGNMEFQAQRAKTDTLLAMDNALSQVKRTMDYVGEGTTGLLGWALKEIPGSDAAQLSEFLKTQLGGIAFDKLQEMRRSNETGGALGNVSNVELDLLQKSFASLSTNNPEELRKSLIDVMARFEAVKFALEKEDYYQSKGYKAADMRREINNHVNKVMATQMKTPDAALEMLNSSDDPDRFQMFEDKYGWSPRGQG